MNVLQIKAAVRERDEYKCTECGMTNFEHVLETNRSLEVHRLVPGSKYSIDGCVTLCRKCHGPKPRTPKGLGNRLALYLETHVVLAVKMTAVKTRKRISELVNQILEKALAEEIKDARKYVPKSKEAGQKVK